jgi:hypothetical protein
MMKKNILVKPPNYDDSYMNTVIIYMKIIVYLIDRLGLSFEFSIFIM